MEREADTARVLIPDTLGLLPAPGGRLSSFIKSLVLNVAIGTLLFWLTMTQLHKAPVEPRYVSTELIFPSRLRPAVPRLKALPRQPVVELPRRIELQRHSPELPEPEVVRFATPAMPAIPTASAPTVVTSPQPRVGLFAGAKRVPEVKSDGFGDPLGVPANAKAARAATIAAMGQFDNISGVGQGKGAAHAGLVTTGGFGPALAKGADAPGGTGNGHGTVGPGGFGGDGIGSGAPVESRVQQVHFSPPEVLSEPRPQYTQEARQLRVQGEVTLQVRFGVNGKVEVLRIVAGLGHGLDQEAALVAEQIRFKPAVKDGQPTDHVTYIHILFQLA